MSESPKIARLCVEVVLAATAGMAAVVLPVVADPLHPHYPAAFLVFIADAVEGMKLYSLGLLVVVGLLLGLFGRGPVLLLGPATMLLFPIWSAADMLAGSTGHNLWPIEWFFYGIESLFGLLGAGIGRGVKRMISKRLTGNGAHGDP